MSGGFDALQTRLRLLVAAGFVVLATPFLAGLGGAGGYSVGIFAAIFAARYMLTNDPARWAHPVMPALGVAVNAVVAGALWLLGGWVSRVTAWAPGWGALPPVLLSVAATALSVQLWSARRDAAVNGMIADVRELADTAPDTAGEPDDPDEGDRR